MFWPEVRQRMKERALQLYKKEHPKTEKVPSLQELNRNGYMRTAKTMTLRRFTRKKGSRPKNSLSCANLITDVLASHHIS